MINVLNHQGLYDAYPAQQYTHANITSETSLPPRLKKLLIGKGEGSYNHTGYGGEPLIEATAYSPKDTSVTLHELQHAIQQQEGFARGGNSETIDINYPGGLEKLTSRWKELRDQGMESMQAYLKASGELAYSGYKRLAGEAEARLTQSRMNMTAPERAASYPPSMFDVPVKDQIVRYGDEQSMSVPKFPKTDGEIRSEIAQRNAKTTD